MSPIARAMKRLLRKQGPLRKRSAEGHFRTIRAEQQLTRSAFLLAHYGGGSPVVIQNLLAKLWDLDSTTLYVQIEKSLWSADLVLSRQPGHRIVATGQKFRVETATHEPAPDGAYLIQRQYRRLGFYEAPPAERALIALRIVAGAGRTYLVDVPHYVSHATIVVDNHTVADAMALPARGELRYSFGAD